jgi:membrane protease YdiL (CAAX protease family)
MPDRGVNLAALANGSVRGRHIFVLFGLVYFLAFAVAYWLSLSVDPLIREAWRSCLWGLAIFGFFSIITVCVREIRRLFYEVIRAGDPATPPEILLAAAVMLTWGLGASRMLFDFPIVMHDADFGFRWLNLRAHIDPGPIFMLIATFTAVVVAPITEEIIFRGYLLNLLLARHGMGFAVWGSSIAFGLWHFKTAPFATGIGLILALVYVRFRSLILCMVLHGLYNLLLNRMLLGHFVWEKNRATVAELSSWSIELALAFAFVPLAFVFWKRFRPQSAFSS